MVVYHSKPQPEIHHVALIQHQDKHRCDCKPLLRWFNEHAGERTSSKTFFCLKHSEIPTERKKEQKIASLLSDTQKLYCVKHPFIPAYLFMPCCFFTFKFRLITLYLLVKLSYTYTGNSTPTSCLQFPGSISVCAHIPAVHLAEREKEQTHERKCKIRELFHEVIVQIHLIHCKIDQVSFKAYKSQTC